MMKSNNGNEIPDVQASEGEVFIGQRQGEKAGESDEDEVDDDVDCRLDTEPGALRRTVRHRANPAAQRPLDSIHAAQAPSTRSTPFAFTW
ncbi:hypothetical protein Nepgr_010266 [Nepenthes gracilis]|uniref:Uncharacterized protein n=1 Tax=Nepenthes gracilis TaxID=150966 RepID=A0AAD3SCS0_NEPGR|nr:hypothetical protein Nepgr_010266 [Nepenthes gracilis]